MAEALTPTLSQRERGQPLASPSGRCGRNEAEPGEGAPSAGAGFAVTDAGDAGPYDIGGLVTVDVATRIQAVVRLTLEEVGGGVGGHNSAAALPLFGVPGDKGGAFHLRCGYVDGIGPFDG